MTKLILSNIIYFRKKEDEVIEVKRVIWFFKNLVRAIPIIWRDGDVVFRDHLTMLYNRRFLEEIIIKETARATRYQCNLSIVIMDIDHFKEINDFYGHLQGDQVLQKVANVLESGRRKSDFAGRWAGDEFLLLLPETSFDSAERLMRIITEKLENQNIQLSYGIASWEEDFVSIKEFIDKADKRMYEHKLEKRLGSRT